MPKVSVSLLVGSFILKKCCSCGDGPKTHIYMVWFVKRKVAISVSHTHTHTQVLTVDQSSFVQVEVFHSITDKIFIDAIFNDHDLEHGPDYGTSLSSGEKCHLTANTPSALVARRFWQTSFCHTLKRCNCGLFSTHFHFH